jgi:hypothetical protein
MGKKKLKFDFQGYITIGYLSIVIMGMMFEYRYYEKFGINIFEYSDILDFLLAPAKNLEVILFAFVTFLFIGLLYLIDNLWLKKRPISYKRFNFGMEKYRPIVMILGFITLLNGASKIYAKMQFSTFNESPKTIELLFESGEKKMTGNIIGKNSDYVFLQTMDKSIKAIPIQTDVQEIIISRPD